MSDYTWEMVEQLREERNEALEERDEALAQVSALRADLRELRSKVPTQGDRVTALRDVTETDYDTLLVAAIRAADRHHLRVGGSSRHYVRECLIPAMEGLGLRLYRVEGSDDTRHALAYLAEAGDDG